MFPFHLGDSTFVPSHFVLTPACLCGDHLEKIKGLKAVWKASRPPTQIYYLVMQLLYGPLVCFLLCLSGLTKA